MAKQISALPTAPSTQRPATFNAEADAFVAALPTFVSEANALATEAATNAQKSEDANTTAQSAKDAAQASAQTASEAKEAAQRSASEAESSAQAAEQIKTQTQEIKQSAQESLATIAAAAQSSAQAAKQSEQAAEQTKTELQTATNTLEQMKSIVKDGFIDDDAQSETKTYSSKKISELNETLKTDVTQEIKRVDESVRADAIKGNLNLPSPFESDLAMWDYMEQTKALFADNNALAVFFKDWGVGISKSFAGHTLYPNLDKKIRYNERFDSIIDATAVLDDDGNVVAATGGREDYILAPTGWTLLKKQNKDGVSINKNQKIRGVASKFILYRLSGDDVAVFGLSKNDDILEYLYKTSILGLSQNTGFYYVFYDLLKVFKQDGSSQTFKITNKNISQIADIDLPKVETSLRSGSNPFYKDFLLYKNTLYRADGTIKTPPICGEALGFLGGTPYLLQGLKSSSGAATVYFIYDIERGKRCVLLPLDKTPISAYLESDGYVYILFTDSVVKTPAKYLTGANFKGE